MSEALTVSALVLRRAEWRDYDRMVTLLTKERGRVEAVVRGCRRSKSELKNAAEPFVCGRYQLFYSHERFTVTQYELTDGFIPLREDFDRLSMGAQWLRLLEKVSVEESPNPGLFDAAVTALGFLAYSDVDLRLIDCMFLLKLCLYAGVAPSADRCALCGKSASSVTLRFSAEKGGCVCPSCAPKARPLSEGARRILFKAPRAPFKSAPLLEQSPFWQEAYERARELAAGIV